MTEEIGSYYKEFQDIYELVGIINALSWVVDHMTYGITNSEIVASYRDETLVDFIMDLRGDIDRYKDYLVFGLYDEHNLRYKENLPTIIKILKDHQGALVKKQEYVGRLIEKLENGESIRF